jgi:glycosyltransferase involved in cell wall biosynthesis
MVLRFWEPAIGGIPELIKVGETGELFKSGDNEDLKQKLEALWNDTEN